MRKLLVIIPAIERGGAETYAQTIATAATQAWEVHAAVTQTPKMQPVVHELLQSGVQCHALRFPERYFTAIQQEHRWKNPTTPERNIPLRILRAAERNLRRATEAQRLAGQWMRTVRLLSRVRPDVILLNICWGTFGLGMILACAFMRIPTAVVFHAYPFPFAFRDAKLHAYRWARQRHQRWIAVTEHSRLLISRTFGAPQEDLVRIYNGIRLQALHDHKVTDTIRCEVRAELGLPHRAVILLTVARLERTKGFEFLVRALPRLIRDFPDVRCVWVGEGKDREWITGQVHEHGVAEHVLFTGYRSDVERLMRAADLFVLPTQFEGLPFVLLEAMARRLPIVASDVGGIPELIHDHVHGLLTRAGDSCSLLEALRWALHHPEKVKAMALAAEQRVQEFSEERMIRDTFGVLESLTETRTSGGGL